MPGDRDKVHVHMPFELEMEQIRELQSKVGELEAEIKQFKELKYSKFKMFAANALIDLARMIAKNNKPELLNDSSTKRLQQFAANIKPSQSQEMAVPEKYWPLLQKLNKYITARNQQAYETSEEFAQLLLSNEFKESYLFEMWKDIFPLLYGATVEEIAAQKEEEDRMLFGF